MGRHIENPYDSKRYEREKMKKLANECDSVYEDGERYRREYKGKRSKQLKKQSNKRIRRTEDLPNNPHKVFDYEWEMY